MNVNYISKLVKDIELFEIKKAEVDYLYKSFKHKMTDDLKNDFQIMYESYDEFIKEKEEYIKVTIENT